MAMKDLNFLTPGAGETLEFGTGATVSGVLITDEVYRIAVDADCWIELDDGAGGMSAGDSTAMLMTNDSVEYIRTSDEHFVLHALGTTTSGLCNYIHMKNTQ